MLKDWLLYGNNYCAIEHTVDENGNERINCLLLVKRKKALIKKDSHSFSDLEEASTFLKNKTHIFLVVNNQQVLLKKADYYEENKLKTVQLNYPNITISDFYVEIVKRKEAVFMAICRKEIVDNLVKKYEELRVSIIDFSLGSLATEVVIPFTDEKILCTSNSEILTEENTILEIRKNVFDFKEYNINGLTISNNELLALSGIISFYFNREVRNTTDNNYLQKRTFLLGYKVVLAVFFFVLLINFLVFSSYHSQINSLQADLQVNESYKKQLTGLKKLVATKEQLVQGLTTATASNIAEKVDGIVKRTPKTIILSELHYQPILNTIKERKPILIKNKGIIVKGITVNNTDFTNWITTLESIRWIKRVKIIHFGKEKRHRASNTTFEFLIELK